MRAGDDRSDCGERLFPHRQYGHGQLNLEQATLADGDHYKLTISDEPSGAVLGKADQKVQYGVDYPNGPDCPGECKVAKLKLTPQ